MNDQIVVVERSGSRIRTAKKQLIVERDDESYSCVIEDLFALIVDTPGALITSAALRALSCAGVIVIITDEKHLPGGLFQPIVGHSLLQKRLRLQLEVSLPTKKRIWRDLVIQKVKGQGRTLAQITGGVDEISFLSKKVGSGDPTNIEAQAAKKYWPKLFEDSSFRRMRANEDQNRLLNFGYSIVRSALARNIVAAGLHPALGIHHSNQYNAFCLADDLIEPFRPFIDLAVAQWLKTTDSSDSLDIEARKYLVGISYRKILINGEEVSCIRATELAVQCFVNCLEDTRTNWCDVSW